MAETYKVAVAWNNPGGAFAYDTFDRTHTVAFGSGVSVAASAGASFNGDASKVNPEEQLIGALASCHMLTFLALCARKRLVVLSYEDSADGVLSPNEQNKLWVSEVTLRPRVSFAAGTAAVDLDQLHVKAHDNCFIANSVKTRVTIAPRV